MKAAYLKILLAVVVFSSLSACGVGVENNEAASAQQRKDAKALNDRFDIVRGTYEGTFANPDKNIPPSNARFLLTVVNIREGTNADGTVRVRPALFGRFQLVDVVGPTDYLSVQGSYDELGALTMTSAAATSGATSGAPTTGGTSGGAGTVTPGSSSVWTDVTINGSAGNDQVAITVSNTSGVWGKFSGQRTSQSVPAPRSSDAAELRDRLLVMYQKIVGSYAAKINGRTGDFPVEITMSIAEGGVGGAGVSIPYLIGQYRRLDLAPGAGDRQVGVNFDPVTGQITLNAIQGGSPTVPGSLYFTGIGTWKNDVLDLDLNDNRGKAGHLHAKRQ